MLTHTFSFGCSVTVHKSAKMRSKRQRCPNGAYTIPASRLLFSIPKILMQTGRRRIDLFGKYFDSVFGYKYHIFDLRGQSVVDGIYSPAVIFIDKKVRTSFVDHRLNGEHHARYEKHFAALWSYVAYEGVFVKFKADTMAADFFNYGVTVCFCVCVDRIGDIT